MSGGGPSDLRNFARRDTSHTQTDIDIDLTRPGIVWSGSIADHFFGSTPVAPSCTATDSLSGPKDCDVTGRADTVGTHTLRRPLTTMPTTK